MSPSEAGILFCCSALFLFTYGLTISGYIIDKLGVKISLIIGLTLYAIAKFILIFADNRITLWVTMCTLAPFGISIIFDRGEYWRTGRTFNPPNAGANGESECPPR